MNAIDRAEAEENYRIHGALKIHSALLNEIIYLARDAGIKEKVRQKKPGAAVYLETELPALKGAGITEIQNYHFAKKEFEK